MALDFPKLRYNVIKGAILNQSEPIQRVIERFGVDEVFIATKKIMQAIDNPHKSEMHISKARDVLKMIEKDYYPLDDYPEKWI